MVSWYVGWDSRTFAFIMVRPHQCGQRMPADCDALLEYRLHLCQGFIIDALLECLPAQRRQEPAYRLLFQAQPGAALACPYCNGLLGFDNSGNPQPPQSGWPIFHYGKAVLE